MDTSMKSLETGDVKVADLASFAEDAGAWLTALAIELRRDSTIDLRVVTEIINRSMTAMEGLKSGIRVMFLTAASQEGVDKPPGV